MKLLWVLPNLPWPADDGNRLRHFHLLQVVARVADVTLIAGALPNETACSDPFLDKGIRVDLVPNRQRSQRWIGTMTGRPACMVPAHISELADRVSRHDGDVAFGSLSVAPALISAPTRATVVDTQNVEAELYRRLARAEAFGARKAARILDVVEVGSYERRWLKRFGNITAVSERDAEAIERIAPNARVAVVPGGIEPNLLELGARQPSRRLVFVGSFSYWPNSDAASFVVEDVMPKVWSAFPDVVLDLVGRNPPESVRRLESERVNVTGRVASVVPYLRTAAAAVVPLRTGGGTKLKVLEAMATGTPVISTPIGAEGLPLEHGKHVLIADHADGIAEQIGRLLDDPVLAGRLSTNARQLVRESFTWEESGAKLMRNFESILAT